MMSQMNAVQNAARLAMADHRAADPRAVRHKARPRALAHPVALAAAVSVALFAAMLIA